MLCQPKNHQSYKGQIDTDICDGANWVSEPMSVCVLRQAHDVYTVFVTIHNDRQLKVGALLSGSVGVSSRNALGKSG